MENRVFADADEFVQSLQNEDGKRWTDEVDRLVERQAAQIPLERFLEAVKQQGASPRVVSLLVDQLTRFSILQDGVVDMLVMESFTAPDQIATNFPITDKILRQTLDAIRSEGKPFFTEVFENIQRLPDGEKLRASFEIRIVTLIQLLSDQDGDFPLPGITKQDLINREILIAQQISDPELRQRHLEMIETVRQSNIR